MKSEAIIKRREAEGDFKSKDGFTDVDGIDRANLDAIRNDIIVDSE